VLEKHLGLPTTQACVKTRLMWECATPLESRGGTFRRLPRTQQPVLNRDHIGQILLPRPSVIARAALLLPRANRGPRGPFSRERRTLPELPSPVRRVVVQDAIGFDMQPHVHGDDHV